MPTDIVIIFAISLRQSFGPDFDEWWKKSCDIVDDWNQIKKVIGENNE